ncbi:hypothetical protein HU200_027597 [Digitaria exilis]|uniref:Uncharacterized protein n=1 Tax=Digitaria exilis TaxID=1010633 RepID=A0A835ETL2_9POAL|nr:hypothetical protein HU200_027597 [Digitaria exilis]
MWGGGVLSLVRQGLRLRRWPRRRTARVVDEGADAAAGATGGDVVAVPPPRDFLVLARAVLAAARGAVGRLDGGAEEAWAAASGWRPARAADEVGHLMVRESLRYVIYA